MGAERLPMRQIREILRLKHDQGLRHRAIARACGVGVHCVGTDDYQNVGPVCPNAREPRPEDPVCALEQGPFRPGTAKNHELRAQGKILQSQILAGANQRAQGSEDGDEHGDQGGILP